MQSEANMTIKVKKIVLADFYFILWCHMQKNAFVH